MVNDAKKSENLCRDLCRVCGKAIPQKRDTHGPFCSERCRLNDLSKWFGENYRIASSPAQGYSVDDDEGTES
jgi:endogenous inhibitor of DNA gyrase (YacG/DUF329 family)